MPGDGSDLVVSAAGGAEIGEEGAAQITILQIIRQAGCGPDLGERVLEIGLLIGALRPFADNDLGRQSRRGIQGGLQFGEAWHPHQLASFCLTQLHRADQDRPPGPTVFQLMDLPLAYLATISNEPAPAGMDAEEDDRASRSLSAAAD